MIKNRKGDVPVMILVIGVLAIMILAVLSFVFSISRSKESVSGYIAVEMANSLREQYYFYEKTGYSTAEIENILGIKKDNDGYYSLALTISGETVVVRFVP